MYELNGIRMVREGRTILSIDHLTIPTDQMTLILGHNGSGKSTLASIISGLVKPDAGEVLLDGRDLFAMPERERARRVAFLPQKLPASAGLARRTKRRSTGRLRRRAQAASPAPSQTTSPGASGSAFGSACSSRRPRP